MRREFHEPPARTPRGQRRDDAVTALGGVVALGTFAMPFWAPTAVHYGEALLRAIGAL